jgi:DNA-binding transcriptional LysR family regulator
MELRHLRYFLAVAEALHFGRAAQRLQIAGPSLSQQINRLERHLGVRLFERDSRRVVLTPAGEVLLLHAERMLAAENDLLAAMRETSQGLTGTTRLGLFMGGAGPMTPILLRAFRAANPKVSVVVRELDTTDLIEPLTTREIDAALIWGHIEDPRLELTALTHEPRVLVMSDTHPLAEAATLDITEVLELRHINHVPGEPAEWDGFWNLLPERDGTEPERVDIALDGDVASQLRAISYSDAVITIPAMALEQFPAAHFGLRYIPVDDLPPAACSLVTLSGSPSFMAQSWRRVAREFTDRMSD